MDGQTSENFHTLALIEVILICRPGTGIIIKSEIVTTGLLGMFSRIDLINSTSHIPEH